MWIIISATQIPQTLEAEKFTSRINPNEDRDLSKLVFNFILAQKNPVVYQRDFGYQCALRYSANK
jgi:hypothetical protein